MIKVDCAPRQSDHLSLTEPENQDQHVRGVQRITIPLCRLQEAPRLISGPGLDLSLARLGHSLARLGHGIHAIGSLGAAHYLTSHLDALFVHPDLFTPTREQPFSAVILASFDGLTITHSELIAGPYPW
jgi:hypothetical protein